MFHRVIHGTFFIETQCRDAVTI